VTAPAGRPIVVGVDGSEPARAAIALGAREARLRGRPLHLVHAFIWPLTGVYLGPSPAGPPDGGLAAAADRILAEALAQAGDADPGLAVTGEVVTGAAATVLLEQAERAEMVVLGHRGLGGFAGMLVGSVAVQVTTHSPGPVLIARAPGEPTGPVLVGVDGSPTSDRAVEFAFAEAAARDAELVAVHTWWGPVSRRAGDMLPLVYDADEVHDEGARLLAESLAGWRGRYPDVRIRRDVRRGRPDRTLVELSVDAALLVVGARGRGGFAGLRLGSVSQAVLNHARCPVAIVRHRPIGSD